jgi:hypothetical protein
MGTRGSFPTGKAGPGRKADHLRPSTVEVKNVGAVLQVDAYQFRAFSVDWLWSDWEHYYYMIVDIQLYHKSVTSYSIVLDISGFWQRQEVWSSDTSVINLVRVQKTRHAYIIRWKNQVKNSLCLPANENYAGAIIASFEFPNERWNGMYV